MLIIIRRSEVQKSSAGPRPAAFRLSYLTSHHVQDGLLPFKQTLRHFLEPRTELLVRTLARSRDRTLVHNGVYPPELQTGVGC